MIHDVLETKNIKNQLIFLSQMNSIMLHLKDKAYATFARWDPYPAE